MHFGVVHYTAAQQLNTKKQAEKLLGNKQVKTAVFCQLGNLREICKHLRIINKTLEGLQSTAADLEDCLL